MRRFGLVILLLFPLAVFGQSAGHPYGSGSAAEEGDGLATFSITQEISGMRVPGVPVGAGDKKVQFSLKFPADNLEVGLALWYTHLKVLFGDDAVDELEAAARAYTNPVR